MSCLDWSTDEDRQRERLGRHDRHDLDEAEFRKKLIDDRSVPQVGAVPLVPHDEVEEHGAHDDDCGLPDYGRTLDQVPIKVSGKVMPVRNARFIHFCNLLIHQAKQLSSKQKYEF